MLESTRQVLIRHEQAPPLQASCWLAFIVSAVTSTKDAPMEDDEDTSPPVIVEILELIEETFSHHPATTQYTSVRPASRAGPAQLVFP